MEIEVKGFKFGRGLSVTVPDGWRPLHTVEVRGELMVVCAKDVVLEPVAPVPPEPIAPSIPEPSVPGKEDLDA